MSRQLPGFALVVRAHPYQRRSARAELDIALAALTMDFRVEIYFVGASILQLLAERNAGPAALPAAYRAWASLPDLGECGMFAEQSWVDRLATADVELVIPVQGLNPDDWQLAWRRCDYSMVV